MSLPEASAYLHEQCGLGESNEAVLEMIFDRMRAFYANEVEARPGALAFVQALHERGVPMAVASSTPADMLATCVERCGFAPYMKTVVSVDDLQTSKREPAVYDHARSFLGTDRAHTWGFRRCRLRPGHPARGRLPHWRHLRQRHLRHPRPALRARRLPHRLMGGSRPRHLSRQGRRLNGKTVRYAQRQRKWMLP